MKINLLTRRRLVLDHEVREPTLLALGLTAMGLVVLIGLCIVGMVFLPVFGHIGWALVAIAGVLAWLVVDMLRKRQAGLAPPTGRSAWFRLILGLARIVFIGLLACWLALIVWLLVCPGGPAPPLKDEPALIRVMTWNIHCGQEEGWPWKQFDWPARQHALTAALDQAQPDILCVQEATPDQVAFLETKLPGHGRVGIGRDGDAGGEHCAIYFHQRRFDKIAGNTFWLEEPIDQPRAGSAFDVKRICTWVRLRDRESGRTFRVYNTHLYLTEAPSLTAARIILEQIAQGDPTDAVLLTADFNAAPSAPSRRLFVEGKSGLADSAQRLGKSIGLPTFQLYGIGVWCIDGILVDSRWRVHNHIILDVKPHNIFPSDHFAILADVALVD